MQTSPNEVEPFKPHRWVIPQMWPGERCFVICGGASVNRREVQRIRGRIIAVKHAAMLRPDADVMFYGGRDSLKECREIIATFKGMIISRGDYLGTPDGVLCVSKTESEQRHRLSTDPRMLSGWDSGGAALNLAYLFGCNPIILVGMDMTGGHWCKSHPKPITGRKRHAIHANGITGMAEDLKERGVNVYNCSPISKLTCFPKRPLSDFI